MKITKIRIQVGLQGPDLLTFETDLPECIYPFRETGASLQMQVGNGKGVGYALEHFNRYDIDVLNHLDEKPKWEKVERED